MKKEFDFEQIGQKMSFDVPDGYFEQLTERTISNISAESKRRRAFIQKLGFSLSAAAVVCLTLLVFTPTSQKSNKANITISSNTQHPNKIEDVLQDMSTSEIEQFVLLAENDYFLNNSF